MCFCSINLSRLCSTRLLVGLTVLYTCRCRSEPQPRCLGRITLSTFKPTEASSADTMMHPAVVHLAQMSLKHVVLNCVMSSNKGLRGGHRGMIRCFHAWRLLVLLLVLLLLLLLLLLLVLLLVLLLFLLLLRSLSLPLLFPTRAPPTSAIDTAVLRLLPAGSSFSRNQLIIRNQRAVISA